MNVLGSGEINVFIVPVVKSLMVQSEYPAKLRINYQDVIEMTDFFMFNGVVNRLEILNDSEYVNKVSIDFYGEYEDNSEVYRFQVYYSMSGSSFYNVSDGALCYIDLPKPLTGITFDFEVTDDSGMAIYAPYDSVITDGEESTEVGGFISSYVLGSNVSISYDSATSWLETVISGEWVFGGLISVKVLSTTTVDLQVTTGQALYTVPAGKVLMATLFVCRGFTANIDKSFTIGTNSTDFNNIRAYITYDSDVVPTSIGSAFNVVPNNFASGSSFDYITANSIQIHAESTAGEVVTLKMASANTAPGTMVVDVIGYLVDE